MKFSDTFPEKKNSYKHWAELPVMPLPEQSPWLWTAAPAAEKCASWSPGSP